MSFTVTLVNVLPISLSPHMKTNSNLKLCNKLHKWQEYKEIYIYIYKWKCINENNLKLLLAYVNEMY